MAKCPFCGSEKTRIETPFVDRVTGEQLKSYCCNAAKKNAGYVARRYDPRFSDTIPTPEEVAKS